MDLEKNTPTVVVLANSMVSKVSWQLTGNTSKEFSDWINQNYMYNVKLNPDFDLRLTAYDHDGYMLVGTADFKEDPTGIFGSIGGVSTLISKPYLYMCTKFGKTTPGFSCAFTEGTPTQMVANTSIGTVTTT